MIESTHVDWVGIPVKDLARAREFYEQTLGLPLSPHSGEKWVEYDMDNVTLALVSPAVMGPGFEPQPHSMPIALRVADVAEARAKLEAAGVEFQGETIDSGVCHMAHFKDPDGNVLQLHRRYKPYADGSTP